MGRRVIICLAVGCAALAIVGCSPKNIGALGLQKGQNGSLTALIGLCEGSASHISLSRILATSTSQSDFDDSDLRWNVDETAAGVHEVDLDRAATWMTDGATYDAFGLGDSNSGLFGTPWPANIPGPESFTVTDLNSLAPSEVLVRDDRNGGSMPITRQQFDASVCSNVY